MTLSSVSKVMQGKELNYSFNLDKCAYYTATLSIS